MAEPSELKRICEQIILHPLEHRKIIEQLILHPPPLMTLTEEMHQPREDEGYFVESIRTLLYWKSSGDFMLSQREELEKILRKDIKMLLELAKEHEKEKAKQQMVMMELEKKLLECQKENKKLLELLDGKQGMVNVSSSAEINSSSLPRKIIGVDEVLSAQLGRKRQVAKAKKENVTLLKFVEDYKNENSKLQMEVIDLRKKLVEQQKQNMLLELAENEDELLMEVVDLRKKLAEQQKQNMLLELAEDCEKEDELLMEVVDLRKKLAEQQKQITLFKYCKEQNRKLQKENKKLLELAEHYRTAQLGLKWQLAEANKENVILWKSVEEKKKEDDKLQLDMIDLENKLVDQQKENKKLLELAEDHHKVQLGLEQQLAEAKKENVILWKSVEEQKREDDKLQLDMIELENKLVDQQKEKKKLLELAEDYRMAQLGLKQHLSKEKKENVIPQKREEEQRRKKIKILLELADLSEKENDEMQMSMINRWEKLVELQKQNEKLIELEKDFKKENSELQLDMMEVVKQLFEQQELSKKLLDLAEDREKEKGELQMSMIEMEKLLGLQAEVTDKNNELQNFAKQPPVIMRCKLER